MEVLLNRFSLNLNKKPKGNKSNKKTTNGRESFRVELHLHNEMIDIKSKSNMDWENGMSLLIISQSNDIVHRLVVKVNPPSIISMSIFPKVLLT